MTNVGRIDGFALGSYDYSMNINHNDYETLILVHRPWLTGLGLAGALCGVLYAVWRVGQAGGPVFASAVFLFAIPLIVMIHIYTRQTIITFDRNQGQVLLVSRTLLGQSEAQFPLSRVQPAEIKIVRGQTMEDSTYAHILHLVLKDPTERHALTKQMLLPRDGRMAQAAINNWLAHGSKQ